MAGVNSPDVSPGFVRRAVGAGALLLVAAAEIGSFQFHEFVPRLRALSAFAGITPDIGRPQGSSAAFDRRYAAFLARIDREIPSGARVALDVPDADSYVFLGRYVLAPRPVISVSRAAEADFVAVFPCLAAPSGFEHLGGGCLGRLR
jgi:hypothetical protein